MICVTEEVKNQFFLFFFYELLKLKHFAAIVIDQSDLNGFHSSMFILTFKLCQF